MILGRIIAAAVCMSLAPAGAAQSNPADIPSSVFATIDGFTQAEIAPDGERLAYLYPLDDRLHLVIHTFATGANQIVPPIEGLDFRWLHWANDNTIVFSMNIPIRIGGGASVETEGNRLTAINVDTLEPTALIKPAEVVGTTGSRTARSYYAEPYLQDNVIDWMPDDPHRIRVAIDEDFDARIEVREIDIRDGDYRIVRNSLDGIQDWIADQSGEIRLGYGVRVGQRRVLLRDTNGDWPELRKSEWFDEGWRPTAFTEDPDVVYVSAYGDHGTFEYRTLRLSTGEFVDTLYSSDTYDADRLMGDPRDWTPIGVSWTDHQWRVEYFDEDFARLQTTVDRALPGSSNYIRSVSNDLRKVVIESRNSFEPGMLLIWDRDAGTMEPFGWLNEELDPELTAEVTPVEYNSADGTAIPAYLTLPLGREARDLPAIVLPHGGPTSRDDTSYWFLSQFLVSRGYAVLQPNFRGSDGYGRAFRRAGREQWGGIMQDDVDSGAAWLVEQGIADPDRICIVGWSYGGYSAAMGLVKSPELYSCGVGINGVYNLPQLISDSKRFVGGSIWTRHIGLDGERSRRVSPHHQADAIQDPILLIHAEDDYRVIIDQAEGFYRELEERDKDATLVTMPHGGHSMVNSAARLRILNAVEAFLAEHIGGN